MRRIDCRDSEKVSTDRSVLFSREVGGGFRGKALQGARKELGLERAQAACGGREDPSRGEDCGRSARRLPKECRCRVRPAEGAGRASRGQADRSLLAMASLRSKIPPSRVCGTRMRTSSPLTRRALPKAVSSFSSSLSSWRVSRPTRAARISTASESSCRPRSRTREAVHSTMASSSPRKPRFGRSLICVVRKPRKRFEGRSAFVGQRGA